MVKYFVCKFDDSLFTTEEELLDHIKQFYVTEIVGVPNNSNMLLGVLKSKYPEYSITIGKSKDIENMVTLSKGDFAIEEYLNDNINHNKLISNIEKKLNLGKKIIELVNKKYNFKSFNFLGFNYGYVDEEHHYNFSITTDKVSEEILYYYPCFDHVDEFIHSLNKYFVNKLEGEPKEIYADIGYFVGYAIDNINISEMMKSKKVRLEIIE